MFLIQPVHPQSKQNLPQKTQQCYPDNGRSNGYLGPHWPVVRGQLSHYQDIWGCSTAVQYGEMPRNDISKKILKPTIATFDNLKA